MSFLNDEPDLSSSQFTMDDLTDARTCLVKVLTEIDPAWLKRPIGPLAEYWNMDPDFGAPFLIHVSKVLSRLYYEDAVTGTSRVILRDKIAGLFRGPIRSRTFEEDLSELEVAYMLSHRVRPLVFEPLALADLFPSKGKKSKSPDYAVMFPEEMVCFEVTNIHFEMLETWERGAEAAAGALNAWLRMRSLRRQIEFTCPVQTPPADLEALTAETVLSEIERSESGVLVVRVGDFDARMKWTADPGQDDADAALHIAEFEAFCLEVFGEVSDACNVVSCGPTIDGDMEEDFVKSFRTSLRRKKGQVPPSMQYVVVVRLPRHDVFGAFLGAFFQSRLFANASAYDWLTGIATFVPARGWHVGAPGEELVLHVNRNATYKASPSLRKLFEGTAGQEWR